MAIPVKVEFLAADPAMSLFSRPRSGLMQGRHLTLRETLRDGPISTRVAVLDLDPEDGMLLPGAPYLPPGPERARGLWQVADRNDMTARDFQQVSVFGAIRTTMAMFEEEDVLGRPLVWAFDGPQLLVVPRAGRMANAFYHRASRSLQFFYFDGVIAEEETTVYTCLSPDIVAHETAMPFSTASRRISTTPPHRNRWRCTRPSPTSPRCSSRRNRAGWRLWCSRTMAATCASPAPSTPSPSSSGAPAAAASSPCAT